MIYCFFCKSKWVFVVGKAIEMDLFGDVGDLNLKWVDGLVMLGVSVLAVACVFLDGSLEFIIFLGVWRKQT